MGTVSGGTVCSLDLARTGTHRCCSARRGSVRSLDLVWQATVGSCLVGQGWARRGMLPGYGADGQGMDGLDLAWPAPWNGWESTGGVRHDQAGNGKVRSPARNGMVCRGTSWRGQVRSLARCAKAFLGAERLGLIWYGPQRHGSSSRERRSAGRREFAPDATSKE